MKYEKLAARLLKKRAFITGAGSGLGLAFSSALASDGWTIGITDIDTEALAKAKIALTAAGGTIHSYQFDVADFAAYGDAAAQFLEVAGGVDLLINNAGIGCGGYLEDISVDIWKRVMDTNLMGAIYGCKLFLPSMKAQGAGHILNLASAAAIVHPPQTSPYNISKAGMVALTESLFNELLEYGIKVSVFMPTFIRTNIGTSTIGTPSVRARAEIAVAKSELTADWAAEQVFRALESEQVYILRPALPQRLWLFKRLFPERFLKYMADYTRKMNKRMDLAAARRAAR